MARRLVWRVRWDRVAASVQEFQQFAEQVLVPIQLLLAMLGMGATLALDDFKKVFRFPKALALGLGLQLIFVPGMAVVFAQAFDLSPGGAVGLILISSVPGGATSNLLTFLGKGNVPLSIALTTTSTLTCVITAPALLRLLASDYLPPDFEFPMMRIFRDIVFYLLLPLAAGMAAYAKLPAHRERISAWAVRLSVAVVLIIAGSSLGSGRIEVGAYGWAPPLIILGFQVFMLFAVPHVLRAAGQDDAAAMALMIEVVVRNVGIALLLVGFFFPEQPAQNGRVLFACLFYAGTATALCIPQLLLHRRGLSPALGRAPLRGERA